jgi:hypothetical protein
MKSSLSIFSKPYLASRVFLFEVLFHGQFEQQCSQSPDYFIGQWLNLEVRGKLRGAKMFQIIAGESI